MKKIKYWIARLKRIWGIIKRHWVRYTDDLKWEISHAEFYANRIAKDPALREPLPNIFAHTPLPKEAYPFNAKNAGEALKEVTEALKEETN